LEIAVYLDSGKEVKLPLCLNLDYFRSFVQTNKGEERREEKNGKK